MSAVMSGVRILEVAEHTFVPLASGILADWGAEVIKIEHVERGDAMRGLATSGGLNVGGNGVHLFMEHANRGKQSIGVDLSKPEGRDIVYQIAKTCDVFLTNKLPAVAAKLKMDVDDIRAVNPNIIYARGTGYGPIGPDRNIGGYDSLGFWARSGIGSAMRTPEMDYIPGQPGPAVGDSIGAMFIAGGISAALFHRSETGEAKLVDVSLLSTGMWAMSSAIAMSQLNGVAQQQPPADAAPPLNPIIGNFKTADNQFISLCMLQGFHYWPEVARVLNHPEWITDPRFDSHEHLQANSGDARKLVVDEFASDTYDNWLNRLRDLKGQWAPVRNTLNIVDDPMVIENGYLKQLFTQDELPFSLVTTPIQFDMEQQTPRRAPSFNENGHEVLARELGLDETAILDLQIAGVVT